MINYIKVRFFDYEESAFYLPRDYCIDFNEESLTTNIVEELLTKCQIII